MKLVLWSIITLLLLSTAYATIDLELADQQFANQSFQGTLTLSSADQIKYDDFFLWNINGNTYKEIIGNLSLEGLPVEHITQSFITSSETTNIISNEFTQSGEITNAVIDLTKTNQQNRSDISEIKNLTLTIQGAALSGSYPHDVTIDLGADGDIDYTYQGTLTNEFEALSKDYLGDNSQDGTYLIGGSINDVYCQKILFKPLKNVKVFVKAANKSSGASLKALISSTPLTKEGISCSSNNCCTFNQVSSMLQESSCTFENLDINQEQDMYVCLFATPGTPTTTYFEIGYESSTKGNGYYNGVIRNKENYYIYASRQKFNTELKTSATIVFNKTKVQALLDNVGLVIPVTVSSSTKGKVELKNLKLEYKLATGQATSIQSFTKGTFTPDHIKLTSDALLPLSRFTSIHVPSTVSDSNKLSIQFLGENTSTKSFKVLGGALTKIQRTTDHPYIGEVVLFSGKASETRNNASIILYNWDFGDNISLSGSDVSHAYNTSGVYTVTLTTKDANNLTDSASIQISVATLEESINFLISDTINKTQETAQLISSATADKAELFSLLKLSSTIEDYKANLTIIDTQIKNVLGSTTMNVTDKEQKLRELNTNINAIRSQLPISFILSSVEFDPKAYSLSDIPEPAALLATGTDSFKEKMLVSQQAASINGKAYELTQQFLSGELKKQIIIKKEVTADGAYYEIIPSALLNSQIISPTDAQLATPSVIKFQTSPLIYSIEGSLDQASQTKTVVLPNDLSSVDIGKEKYTEVNTCGDSVCDSLTESESICPEDCTPSRPWLLIIIVAVVIGAAGAYYIFFYKGKYALQNLGRKKVMPPATLFKSEKDRLAIKQYISSSFKKGFTEPQIIFALKKQGWNDAQVKATIKEVNLEKLK